MTRGKGEGSLYKRADGMWCTSIELPPGPDGKRRRKVVCRVSKPAVLAEMRRIQTEMARPDETPAPSTSLAKWAREVFRAERVGTWQGSSRRTR